MCDDGCKGADRYSAWSGGRKNGDVLRRLTNCGGVCRKDRESREGIEVLWEVRRVGSSVCGGLDGLIEGGSGAKVILLQSLPYCMEGVDGRGILYILLYVIFYCNEDPTEVPAPLECQDYCSSIVLWWIRFYPKPDYSVPLV